MKPFVALLALCGALVAGCGSDKPERPCLSGHSETTLLPIMHNGTNGQLYTTLIPMTQFVCDRYGPAPTASP